jgi:hypothetical protein
MTIEAPSDAVLQHFGIPGMKWGKRKGDSGSDSGGSSSSTGGKTLSGNNRAAGTAGSAPAKEKKAKPTKEEILTARDNQIKRESKFNKEVANLNLATTEAGRTRALKAMEKAQTEYFNNPDTKTAATMTRGEKAATAALAGAYGLAAVGFVAVARQR